MKKLLAPSRRDKPTGGEAKDPNVSSKKLTNKMSDERGKSNQKTSVLPSEADNHDKAISQKFQQKFRNKNLQVIPPQMLVTLSGLTTLDISNNKLNDSQIQLIMNSCTKLSTLCIQGNLTLLIPCSISKLKLLLNFRHDWVTLNPEDIYQIEERLQKIKQFVKKPELLTKINRITGLDFLAYIHNILQISIDKNLVSRIQNLAELSMHSKQNMLKLVDDVLKGRTALKQNQKLDQLTQAQSVTTVKKNDQNRIKSEKELDQLLMQTKGDIIITPTNTNNMPLHYLFANFDKNPQAAAQIDGLLLRGYNPNQYDQNGLSAFHVCIIQGQKKGIQYLLQISANNPGFFDLQMPSLKQGWNILHLSVYTKNNLFTRLLIDFGLPTEKRDFQGHRLIHLVQKQKNHEFQILLRKQLKKKTLMARNLTSLTIPPIPYQNKKNYIKHPQRQRQQSRFRITYSKNDKLLQMYESAVGLVNVKV